MKNEAFPKFIIDKVHFNQFPDMGVLVVWFFNPRTLLARNFARYVQIHQTPILKTIANSFVFNFYIAGVP